MGELKTTAMFQV